MKKYVLGSVFGSVLFISPAVDAQVVETGETYLGVPYQFGGDDPDDGFDPSGFTKYVVEEAQGFVMPRTVAAQWNIGEAVNREEVERGDLLFFGSDVTPTHVAFYAGEDQLLHVTKSGGVERTEFSLSNYWNSRYLGAKRIDDNVTLPDDPFVEEAARYLGVPYVFGEADPAIGFDCSGLMRYVFRQNGIHLPRSAEEQWRVGEAVFEEDMSIGDVVFFQDTYKEGISHNGIYVGDGRFIHASRNEGVTESYLSSDYWQAHFKGVRSFRGLTLPEENEAVAVGTTYVGEVPYVRGGTTPEEGFDTAGFIQFVYEEAYGINLPRYADGQFEFGEEIEETDIVAGDILFFEGNALNPAIYIGDGRIVHVTLSEGVTITNYRASNYWRDKYVGAVRVLDET